MKYPTLKEVENASRETLARWYRFLPSPGWNFAKRKKFFQNIEKEEQIMKTIVKRFEDMGGFTDELSRKIGW